MALAAVSAPLLAAGTSYTGSVSTPSSSRRLPSFNSFGCCGLRSPGHRLGLPPPARLRTFASQAGVTAEVKFVFPDEAKKLVDDGYTVVDIRDNSQYDRARIVPSVHVPYFIENNDSDLGTQATRLMHNGFAGALYGIAFTKVNEDFVPTLEKQFSKEGKLLLVCQEGLRSGTAAQRLEEAGFANVAFLSSGLASVPPGIFAKEGPRELKDAGKAGLVTIQTKISIVLGTILVGAYLFLTLFPDTAEELFFK